MHGGDGDKGVMGCIGDGGMWCMGGMEAKMALVGVGCMGRYRGIPCACLHPA